MACLLMMAGKGKNRKKVSEEDDLVHTRTFVFFKRHFQLFQHTKVIVGHYSFVLVLDTGSCIPNHEAILRVAPRIFAEPLLGPNVQLSFCQLPVPCLQHSL
jgi:hypothetical protein